MSADVGDYRLWAYKVAGGLVAAADRPAADVDDVAQEGLIAAWQATATLDEDKGAAASYLTRAGKARMVNVASRGRPYLGEGDRSRAHGSRSPFPVASLDAVREDVEAGLRPTPSALVESGPDAERIETVARVRAAVAGLPADEREVVTLRDLLGWRPADVEARLGISGGHARALRARAYRRLRASLAAA